MATPRHRAERPPALRIHRLAIAAVSALAVGTVSAVLVADLGSGPQSDTASKSGSIVAARATPAPSAEVARRPPTAELAEQRRPQRATRDGARRPLRQPDEREEIRSDPRKRPDLDLAWRWLHADLNVWSGPGEDHRLLKILPEGTKVRQTGYATGQWAQIVQGDRMAWVRAAYLASEKPAPEQARTSIATGAGDAGASDSGDTGSDDPGTSDGADSPTPAVSVAPCPDGSSVESGLTTNAIGVYRAVCAAFPAVSAWGGLRPGDDGDHGTGQALDIMVGGDSALGQAIADYVQANASDLGVSELIWAQHIWSVQRGSEGWRPMEDRGSPTANHYDHVHVSVY